MVEMQIILQTVDVLIKVEKFRYIFNKKRSVSNQW